MSAVSPNGLSRSQASAAALKAGSVPLSPHRRGMIAKIHVAKKQLNIADDDYRQILLDEAGVMSSAAASDSGLAKVLDRMKSRGFKPKGKHGGAKPADHPSARKARALWLSLYQLGAVKNPAEQALEGFAKRQLKVEAMQWANEAYCYRLIEALKAMAERAGWHQEIDAFETRWCQGDSSVRLRILKRRLVDAILAKLKAAGAVSADWDAAQAMDRLFGETVNLSSVESLELAAVSLGQKLREVVS